MTSNWNWKDYAGFVCFACVLAFVLFGIINM